MALASFPSAGRRGSLDTFSLPFFLAEPFDDPGPLRFFGDTELDGLEGMSDDNLESLRFEIEERGKEWTASKISFRSSLQLDAGFFYVVP